LTQHNFSKALKTSKSSTAFIKAAQIKLKEMNPIFKALQSSVPSKTFSNNIIFEKLSVFTTEKSDRSHLKNPLVRNGQPLPLDSERILNTAPNCES